jgi:hypothetical protein
MVEREIYRFVAMKFWENGEIHIQKRVIFLAANFRAPITLFAAGMQWGMDMCVAERERSLSAYL